MSGRDMEQHSWPSLLQGSRWLQLHQADLLHRRGLQFCLAVQSSNTDKVEDGFRTICIPFKQTAYLPKGFRISNVLSHNRENV